MLPFRELLKPSTEFIWTQELQEAFEENVQHEQNNMSGDRLVEDGLRLLPAAEELQLQGDHPVLLQHGLVPGLRGLEVHQRGRELILTN